MRSRRSVQRKHTALFRRENGSTAVRRSLPANATSGASMMRRFSATSERTATAGRTTIRRTCGIEPQSAACVRARSGRSLAGPFHITASLQPPGRSHGGRLKAQQEVADSMPSSSGCRPVLDVRPLGQKRKRRGRSRAEKVERICAADPTPSFSGSQTTSAVV
jgi:hypothetical protein